MLEKSDCFTLCGPVMVVGGFREMSAREIFAQNSNGTRQVRCFISAAPGNHWHTCPAICGKAVFPST